MEFHSKSMEIPELNGGLELEKQSMNRRFCSQPCLITRA